MSVAKRPSRSRLDIGAANRFIQHGLASSSGISLSAWRERKKAEREQTASSNATSSVPANTKSQADAGTGTAASKPAGSGPILSYSGGARFSGRGNGKIAHSSSKHSSDSGPRRIKRKSKNRTLVLSSSDNSQAAPTSRSISPSSSGTSSSIASGHKRRANRNEGAVGKGRSQSGSAPSKAPLQTPSQANMASSARHPQLKQKQQSQSITGALASGIKNPKRESSLPLALKLTSSNEPGKPHAGHRPSSRFSMLQSPPFHLVSEWAPLDTLTIAIPQVRWKLNRQRSFNEKRRKWQRDSKRI